MNAKFCPRCGTGITPEFAYSPHCGADLKLLWQDRAKDAGIPKASPVERQRMNYRFRCRESGTDIAKALVPEDYLCTGAVTRSGGNDFSPVRNWIKAESPDHSVILFSESRMIWEEYLNPMLKSGARFAGYDPADCADFVEPEIFLQQYAERFAETPLKPTAFAALPGPFAQNRERELNDMLTRFLSLDGSGPNVQMEIINAVCEPLLMKFTANTNSQELTVLIGCEYVGIEYRNAITAAMLMGGTLGMLGSLIGGMSASKEAGTRPFGHGKKADAIRWGFKRMYLCITDTANERSATSAFLHFVTSFRPDMTLAKQMDDAEYQIFLRHQQQANVFAAQARQNQIRGQQLAMETSRMIARNSAEISAGIMDSWNRKMASDSRINQNYSEAVRGVNTWHTTDGRSVEVDVTADHVYQNAYGDVYGVSGQAVDPELVNQLNWTKIG
ncbi:MAG: hypothetical protein IJ242_08165 [Clostridia bacterium]|nr:hypothetical protein [Clostridia bacterium]